MAKSNKRKEPPPVDPPPRQQAAHLEPGLFAQQPESKTPSAELPVQPIEPVAGETGREVGSPNAARGPDVAPAVGTSWREHISFWFGIVGTITGVIGLALGVYFYQVSKIRPALTFAVHPLKTELRRPDFDKDLGFVYRGAPVDSESITAVQVAIWNNGTRGVRDSDVLEPVVLRSPNQAAILSVRVKKATRPVCAFECVDDKRDYGSGTCRLKWRILEPGDGVILQIVYAGDSAANPVLEGTIEGQQEGIRVQEYDVSSIDKTPMVGPKVSWLHLVPITILILAGTVALVMATRAHRNTEAAKRSAEERTAIEKQLAELRRKATPLPLRGWVYVIIFVVCIVSALGILLHSLVSVGPPFGW